MASLDQEIAALRVKIKGYENILEAATSREAIPYVNSKNTTHDSRLAIKKVGSLEREDSN